MGFGRVYNESPAFKFAPVCIFAYMYGNLQDCRQELVTVMANVWVIEESFERVPPSGHEFSEEKVFLK